MADDDGIMGFGEDVADGDDFGFGFSDAAALEEATAIMNEASEKALKEQKSDSDKSGSSGASAGASGASSSSSSGSSTLKRHSSTTAGSDDVKTERAGWLKVTSTSGLIKSSKERWFVLEKGVLLYSASPRAKPIASIPMAQIASVAQNGADMMIKARNDKTLLLIAKDNSEASSWAQSIYKAQRQLAKASTAPGTGGTAMLF